MHSWETSLSYNFPIFNNIFIGHRDQKENVQRMLGTCLLVDMFVPCVFKKKQLSMYSFGQKVQIFCQKAQVFPTILWRNSNFLANPIFLNTAGQSQHAPNQDNTDEVGMEKRMVTGNSKQDHSQPTAPTSMAYIPLQIQPLLFSMNNSLKCLLFITLPSVRRSAVAYI